MDKEIPMKTQGLNDPTYLGDGVYASYNAAGQVVLTIGHHLPVFAENTIYLEPEVMASLKLWLDALWLGVDSNAT
jgi:hypothetical protein